MAKNEEVKTLNRQEEYSRKHCLLVQGPRGHLKTTSQGRGEGVPKIGDKK